MKKMIIVSKEFYHSVGHRLHKQLPLFEKYFDVFKVSLVPISKEHEKELKFIKSDWKKVKTFFKLLFHKKLVFIRYIPQEKLLELRGLPLEKSSSFINSIWWAFLFFLFRVRYKHKNSNFRFRYVFSNNPYSEFTLRILHVLNLIQYDIKIYELTDKFSEFEEGLKKILVTLLENYFIKHANIIICVGKKLLSYSKRLNKNSFLIYNGIPKKYYLKTLNFFENKFYDFIYIGSIEKYMGLEDFIRKLWNFKKNLGWNFKLIIIGEGTQKQNLIKLINDLEMNDSIIFREKMNFDKLKDYIQKSKFGIALYNKTLLMEYAFTFKIIEYWSQGIPVLTTDISETTEMVKKHNLGFVISDKNYTFVIKNIKNIKKEEYDKMAKRCFEYSKKFNFDALMKEEIDIINRF